MVRWVERLFPDFTVHYARQMERGLPVLWDPRQGKDREVAAKEPGAMGEGSERMDGTEVPAQR